MTRILLTLALVLGLAMAAGSALADTDAGATVPASSPDSPDDSAPAATEAPAAESTATEAAGDVYGALKGGQYLIAFGLVLLVIVRLSRPQVAKLIGWFGTRWGGYTYAALWATAMTIGTTLAAGEGFSLGLVMAAAGAAWTAIGQHTTAADMSAAGKP